MARTSDIDFDKIPSPRPNTSSRKSARNDVAGPSSPSKYMRLSQPGSNSGSPDPEDHDNGMGLDPFDDFDKIPSPRSNTSSKKTGRNGVAGPSSSSRNLRLSQPGLNSGSPEPGDQDNGMVPDPFDDYAPELENVGLGLDNDDNQEAEALPPPVKKTKTDGKNQKGQTQSKRKKENIGMLLSYMLKLISLTINLGPQLGVRRSQREHYRPLEYWRGEKLVYGRTPHSGPILVPQIKEIIRIPKDVSLPLGSKRKRGSTRVRSHSKVPEAVEDVILPALPVVDPEEGWDDDTESKCTVIHFASKEEVERRK